MSREKLIEELLDSKDESEQSARMDRIERKLDLLLSVIVVRQKDASEAVGVSDDTIRNKVLRGETEVLQRDGSRLNFLTLAEVGELKPRRSPKRKK